MKLPGPAKGQPRESWGRKNAHHTPLPSPSSTVLLSKGLSSSIQATQVLFLSVSALFTLSQQPATANRDPYQLLQAAGDNPCSVLVGGGKSSSPFPGVRTAKSLILAGTEISSLEHSSFLGSTCQGGGWLANKPGQISAFICL